MNLFEIRVTNVNLSDAWDWQVVLCETVSGTETVLCEGTECTSEAALVKARAAELNARSNFHYSKEVD